MDTIHIHGGVSLQGNVKIQGSKNAALPILAATILTNEKNVIHNCPKISDVYLMLNILKSLGGSVKWEENGVCIDAENICIREMPEEAIKEMRSSLCLLGALLGRCGEVTMEYPGGCVIGARPIDIHIEALAKMGVDFHSEDNIIHAKVGDKLCGATIELPFPSVGATENIILAAVMAEGDTIILGAAKEPEIEALCDYLKNCGAQIEGAGTSQIKIVGNRRLLGAEYVVPADRIVAGTYLYATLATGGCVLLEDAPCDQMEDVIEKARILGAECQILEEGLYVQSPKELKPIHFLETEVYPGFPTDLQSILLVLMTQISRSSIVYEKIFENRFKTVKELNKMGAMVETIDKNFAYIQERSELKGCAVEASDLRGGAALVVAGLIAEGETIVTKCKYIDRGYENICKDLRELGARIYGV